MIEQAINPAVSTLSRPKAAGTLHLPALWQCVVSTLSRPKAAVNRLCCNPNCLQCGFNTQPPEGGCRVGLLQYSTSSGFNTQPPEGGCYSAVYRC